MRRRCTWLCWEPVLAAVVLACHLSKHMLKACAKYGFPSLGHVVGINSDLCLDGSSFRRPAFTAHEDYQTARNIVYRSTVAYCLARGLLSSSSGDSKCQQARLKQASSYLVLAQSLQTSLMSAVYQDGMPVKWQRGRQLRVLGLCVNGGKLEALFPGEDKGTVIFRVRFTAKGDPASEFIVSCYEEQGPVQRGVVVKAGPEGRNGKNDNSTFFIKVQSFRVPTTVSCDRAPEMFVGWRNAEDQQPRLNEKKKIEAKLAPKKVATPTFDTTVPFD